MPNTQRTRHRRVAGKHKRPVQSTNAKRRRVETEVSLSLSESDNEFADVDDMLLDTMQKTCSKVFTLWSVSPLRNLEHVQNKLNKAARSIELNLKHNFGGLFTVSVKTIEGIADKDNDGRAIVVDVQESFTQHEQEEGIVRNYRKLQSCKCILGCRSNQLNKKNDYPLTNGYLPVMIALGPSAFVKKVTKALRMAFDCYFHQLTLEGSGLSTLSAYWIIKDMNDRELKGIKLHLSGSKTGDTAEVIFPLSTLRSSMAGKQRVRSCRLWNVILEKLHRWSILNFDPRAKISVVKTSQLQATLDGRVKVTLKTLEDVHSLWKALTAISESIYDISIHQNL